jgi:hypothetical protein
MPESRDTARISTSLHITASETMRPKVRSLGIKREAMFFDPNSSSMLLPYPDLSKNEFEPDFFLNDPPGRFRHSLIDQNEELNLHMQRSFNIDPNYYKEEDLIDNLRGFGRESGNSFRRQSQAKRQQEKLAPGAKRRKGAGRKTVNPKMEVDLIEWVQNYLYQHSSLTRKLSEAKGHHRAGEAIPEPELQGVEGLVRQVP